MRKLRLIMAAAAVLGACVGVRADEVAHPWPEVEYRFVKRTEPVAEEYHLAVVDLSDHKAKVRVVRAAADPDGAGPAQTVLTGTSKVAGREGFDIAVNGDYFVPIKKGAKDAEGEAAQDVFKAGLPATVLGPAETDGEVWARAATARPMLFVKKDGTVGIATGKAPPKGAEQAIAGNVMLVEGGRALYQDEPDSAFVKQKNTNRQRHPRTVAGVSEDGKKLFIMVVDGRSEISRGMNWKELAKAIADAGAYEAVNLDGGGSSTFVMREGGELKVLNHPSDKKERSVANVLGVTIGKKE